MRLIDSHSHFDAAEFDADRVAAHARAVAAGIDAQVVPAVGVWEMMKPSFTVLLYTSSISANLYWL